MDHRAEISRLVDRLRELEDRVTDLEGADDPQRELTAAVGFEATGGDACEDCDEDGP